MQKGFNGMSLCVGTKEGPDVTSKTGSEENSKLTIHNLDMGLPTIGQFYNFTTQSPHM
jgi:hypothetical protein